MEKQTENENREEQTIHTNKVISNYEIIIEMSFLSSAMTSILSQYK